MPPPLVEVFRHRGRWLTGAALLALAPKCLLCLAAYGGLGAAAGLLGPELCGGAPTGIWPEGLAFAGAMLGLIGMIAARRCRADAIPRRATEQFPPV